MTGANDVTVHALPHDRLQETLSSHPRIISTWLAA